ncbi:MAG: nucleotide exchange factor GrpE [Myxococcota bacterium]|nr:nucleotide exchange factor GrpE [Myxococcota bacterium]
MLPPADLLWTHHDPTAEVDPPRRASPRDEPANVPDRAALAHALRDLEAAKARVDRDAQRVHDATREELVAQLLPVLDNLDRTIRVARAQGDAPAVIEGVVLVRAQLESVLRGYGVERIDATHQPFDPAIHDAISVVAVHDPARSNRVLEQAEPGYRFGARLLRPAKVVVGRLAPRPPTPSRWA